MEKNTDKVLNKTIYPILNNLIKNNKLWYPQESLHYIIFSNIFNIMFGYNLDINDQNFKIFSNNVNNLVLWAGIKLLCSLVGIKSAFIGKLINYFGYDKYLLRMYDIFNKWILKSTGYDIHPSQNRFEFKGKV